MKKPPHTTVLAVRSILKGSLFVAIGMLIGKILAFFVKIIIARNLDPSNFGIFTLALSIVTVLASLLTLGLPLGVTKYIAHYKELGKVSHIIGTLHSAIKVLLPTGISAVLLIMIFSGFLANIFNKQSVVAPLRILSPFLLFQMLTLIILASLRGEKAMKQWSLIDSIVPPATRLALLGVLLFWQFTVQNVAMVFVLSSVIVSLLAWFFLSYRVQHYRCGVVPSNEIPTLLAYSWPLFVSNTIYELERKVDIFLVGFFLMSGQLGIYSVALATAILLLIPLYAINKVFMPTVSTLYAQRDNEAISRLYKIATNWVIYLTFPIFLVYMFFAGDIIMSVYGHAYVIAAPLLQILSIGFVVNTIIGPEDQIQLALGITRPRIIISTIVLASAVILNVILIPHFGITGAAIATALAWLIGSFLSFGFLYYYTKLHPFNIRPLLAMLVQIALLFIFKTIFGHLNSSNSLLYLIFLILTYWCLSAVLVILLLEHKLWRGWIIPHGKHAFFDK